MKITDQYKNGLCPISFEIFPPKGELHPEGARLVLSGLKELSPAYISVTCSAGGTGGSSRKTAELSGIVQNEFGITAAAHITGINAKKCEVDAAITDIKAHGITNILALRGDRIDGAEPGDFRYGAELISYLRKSPEAAGLTIGAGCYPEGHVDCESFDKDLDHLKEKADAGAEYLISQLFFENESYYRFIDRARAKGITLPVDAGIMPIMGKSQITRMVFLCGASLPAPVVRILAKYENDSEALRSACLDYAAAQIIGLIESGAADGIHIYSMNKPDVAKALVSEVCNARH